MQITGGIYKGRKVIAPDENITRPTLSKVRMGVFNTLFSLIGDFEGKSFLDLFGGSGIMGLEALSRGFERVKVFEKNPKVAQILKKNYETLGLKPDLKIGDTVRVHQRIKEGNRERIQVFEGIIIKKQGGSVNATFTVRRIAYGVGVEKTFLVHSPLVEKVEVVRVGKARRAKLYYLRDRVGKAAKTKENVGAKIESKYIEVKADTTVEPVVEEVKATETVEVAEAPVAEAPKAE